MAAFNLSDKARKISVDPALIERDYARATELWTGVKPRKGLSVRLTPHDCAVWQLEY